MNQTCIFPSHIAHSNVSDCSHSEYTGVLKMVSKKAARISIFGNFNSYDNAFSISTYMYIFCTKTELQLAGRPLLTEPLNLVEDRSGSFAMSGDPCHLN